MSDNPLDIFNKKALIVDTFFDIVKIADEAREQAPVCSGFLAHHSVPYGRLYRQWDTKGRLWCWVNKGWMADLPVASKKSWAPGDPIYDIHAVPVIDVHARNRRLQFGEDDG
jgi:hypothetical protein